MLAGHGAGVDLQQCGLGIHGTERLQRCRPVAGVVLIKELSLPVQLGDQVDMAENGGLPPGHGRHLPVIGRRHGETVAAESLVQAGGQLGLVPVDGMITAVRTLQIVDAADPVIERSRQLAGGAVQLDTQQHLHPPFVGRTLRQHRRTVLSRVLR